MLSTEKSTMPVAPPLQSAVTREMILEMIASALSYTLEAGGAVKHRVVEGELWVRVQFSELDIKIHENDKGVVSFVLVPKEPEPLVPKVLAVALEPA